MSSSQSDTTTKLLSMTAAERSHSLAILEDIFTNDIEDIRRYLGDYLRKSIASAIITIHGLYRDKIKLGLAYLLCDQAGQPDQAHRFRESVVEFGAFFVHLFCGEYLAVDQRVRAVLRGKFRDGLKSDMAFPALFLELANAAFFRRLGNSARFGDDATVSAPDLLISSEYFDLWMECKCIYAMSMSPIPERLQVVSIESLVRALKVAGTKDCQLFIAAKYFGKRNTDFAQAVHQLKVHCEALHAGSRKLASPLWEIDVRNLHADEVILEDFSGEGYFRFARSPRYEGYCGITFVQGCGIVGLKSALEWDLSEAVSRQISLALKQLGSAKYRQICIQVLGATTFLPLTHHDRPIKILGDIAMSNPDTRRRLNDQFHRRDGFVGLRLLGDFHLNLEEDGRFVLGCEEVAFSSLNSGDAFAYVMNFLGRLPSVISLRPELGITVPW